MPDNAEIGIRKVVGFLMKGAKVKPEKTIELSLKDSELRYRRLFESAQDGILILDAATGMITDVNPFLIKMLGYSREEFVEKKLWEVGAFRDIKASKEAFEALQENEYIRYEDLPLKSSTGKLIQVEFVSNVYLVGKKKVIQCNIRDISERKKAEDAFQESEAKFHRMVEHLPLVVYLTPVDDAGFTLFVSPQIEILSGYKKEEWLADPKLWAKTLFAKDRPHILRQITELGQKKEPLDIEYRMKAKDGHVVWVHDQVILVEDPEGNPLFRQGIMLDITERKQSEEKIQRQLDHLTALRNIDRVIASNFDLELSLTEILTHVTLELGVDAADILLINTNSQMLEFGAERGFRTKAISKARIPLSESYAGHAVQERQIVHVPNLKLGLREYFRTALLTSENFYCYYGVPLIIKGQVKGVLEIFHRSALKPDDEWFSFLNALAGQAAIAIENSSLFESLQRSNSALSQAYDATIEGWSHALDLRDKETEGHTQRVTEMTVKLGRAFGLSEIELEQVRWGALLHDIGKMGVPDEILNKAGPLTEDEWVMMKKHPSFAYELLSPIRYLRQALDIPYCHHEKWNGTGYPKNLQGDQIPLTARIFAVVDVWDALNSDRPYRPAWTKEKAREYIRNSSGTHFDPQVVSAFMTFLDSYKSPPLG